jgi:urease accessory protein
MSTESNGRLALARLLQLVSPSLPIGAYSYSQGIEWAVEAGWIKNREDLRQWMLGLIETGMQYVDLPVLKRMLLAWQSSDIEQLYTWNDFLIASRETRELRLEEQQRGKAFAQLLITLEPEAEEYRSIIEKSQIAGYSFACCQWHIDLPKAASGLIWSWLENQVLSAVKAIPLGQTDGQKIIFELSTLIPDIVSRADLLVDDDLGASSFALAIASAQHETQYTRLFRS